MENNTEEIVLIVENVREIYVKYEWLQKAILKKIRKGIKPNQRILMESSELKAITRMARKKNVELGGAICTMADDKEARRRLAETLLEVSEY